MSCVISSKYFPQIDLMKGFMAIVVVAVHTLPPTVLENPILEKFLSYLYQLPVPFFFVVSGFFLWNKVADSSKELKLLRIRKWVSHVFFLYVLWTLLYLPYTIYGFWIEHCSIVTSFAVFIRNFLFVGQNFFSWPLWYLLGMCVSGVIIYGSTRIGLGVKNMVAFGLLMIVLGSLLDWYHNTETSDTWINFYYKLFRSTHNGFFQGFPYMMAGVLIAEKGCVKSNLLLAFLVGISIVFLIYGFTIALFPLMYFGVQGLLKFSEKAQSFPSTVSIRLMSNIFYFTHMLWVGFFVLFLNMDYSIAFFFLTLCVCLIVSFAVLKNSENKWVRLLFR